MDKVIRDGLVAMQHRNSNPSGWKTNDGTHYMFVPKMNVSMAMVKEEHVEELLAVRAKICCGKNGSKFVLGSLINYNLWKYGDRHGPTSEESLK